MNKKYNSSLNCIFNINYHIIWSTKYRKKLLNKLIEIELKNILKNKSKNLGIIIKAFEIMPDHVHIFVSCTPIHSIVNIVKQLKGYSSFYLRKKFTNLQKLKSLWTHSYFCESIGCINEKTIIKYIKNQKFA